MYVGAALVIAGIAALIEAHTHRPINACAPNCTGADQRPLGTAARGIDLV
jgi:hypothetical protein